MKNKNKIEVCFSPSMYKLYDTEDSIVVVVDILRATSVITTMFMNGVDKVIPVKNLDEARKYKEKGYMVVAERDGKKLDFADFGNSPDYFKNDLVKGKTLVYSTTNGTNAINVGADAEKVIIGSYLNFKAIVKYILEYDKNVLLLCAGWKNKFNIEDSLYCGYLANELLKFANFFTICDSTKASIDLYEIANKDLHNYIQKVAQKGRLQKMGYDDVIPYCHTFDLTCFVPSYKNGSLTV